MHVFSNDSLISDTDLVQFCPPLSLTISFISNIRWDLITEVPSAGLA